MASNPLPTSSSSPSPSPPSSSSTSSHSSSSSSNSSPRRHHHHGHHHHNHHSHTSSNNSHSQSSANFSSSQLVQLLPPSSVHPQLDQKITIPATPISRLASTGVAAASVAADPNAPKMRAVLQSFLGGVDSFYIGTTKRPIAKVGEVVIKVHAFSVNRADIYQRQGYLSPAHAEANFILGLEVAGEIVEFGPEEKDVMDPNSTSHSSHSQSHSMSQSHSYSHSMSHSKSHSQSHHSSSKLDKERDKEREKEKYDKIALPSVIEVTNGISKEKSESREKGEKEEESPTQKSAVKKEEKDTDKDKEQIANGTSSPSPSSSSTPSVTAAASAAPSTVSIGIVPPISLPTSLSTSSTSSSPHRSSSPIPSSTSSTSSFASSSFPSSTHHSPRSHSSAVPSLSTHPWKIGDRVMCCVDGGAYAEYCKAKICYLLPIPDNVSYENAAAIPECFLTAFQSLYTLGHAKKGESILVHSAASGVGSAAVLMSKALGLKVIGTTSTNKKMEYCNNKLHIDLIINYKSNPQWLPIVQQYLTNQLKRDGVDIVMDCIGATYIEQNLEVLTYDSRWIIYSLQSGSVMDQYKLPLHTILRKRVSMKGTVLRAYGRSYRVKLVDDFYKKIIPLIANGKINVTQCIERIFDFTAENLMTAHAAMEANLCMGKTVFRVKNHTPWSSGGEVNGTTESTSNANAAH